MGIDCSGLYELDKRFSDVLKDRKDLRKRMHDKIAAELKSEVLDSIQRTGIRPPSGRLRRGTDKNHRPSGSLIGWQKDYAGSGGGYAAVRPVGKAEGVEPGMNSAGAITNYLEHGHRVRGPTGEAKRMRKSRAKQGFARGYYFYTAARGGAQKIALDIANEYVESIADRLGD